MSFLIAPGRDLRAEVGHAAEAGAVGWLYLRIMFTKLDLIERIIATTDEKVLEKVGKALATEEDDLAFTKEHLALLEERRARRNAGEGKGYTLTEVKRMLKKKK